MSSSCECGLAYMPAEAEVDQADKTRGNHVTSFTPNVIQNSLRQHTNSLTTHAFEATALAIGIHSCSQEMVGKTLSPRECMLNSQ